MFYVIDSKTVKGQGSMFNGQSSIVNRQQSTINNKTIKQ